MLDDVIIYTQEIRERVVSIGRKLSFVTNLIIGTDDNRGRHLQSNLVEAVFPNCIHKPLKADVSKGKKTIQKSNTNKLCIDLCSSDSDEEWNDNWSIARSGRKVANHGKSISQLRAPFLASIEFCGDAAAPNTDSNSSCAVVDIEILEENNNDPNNNLDSIESFQEEGANLISALPNAAFKMESAKRFSPTPGCSKDFDTANISVRDFARCWSSPTPGCSKDADDTNRLSVEEITSPTPGCSIDFNLADDTYRRDPTECSNSLTKNYGINSDDNAPGLVDEKLQAEAVQICSLLPKFTYQRVYAALCKNPDAENRVELCLWDLLPWKRPTARFPTKRKFVDDNSVRDCKNVSPKLSIVEQKEMEFNLCDDDISFMNDYDLLDGSLNGQDALNIGGSKNETTRVHENYENNEPGKDKVSLSIQNGILQPAKLIVKRGPVQALHVSSPNRSILSPPKLLVTAQCNDKAGKTMSPYDETRKGKIVTRNNGAPIARNVFLAPSSNLPANDGNNSKEHAFHKYMRYLDFMQNAKRQHSSGRPIIFKGKLKHVDIEARKEIREAFLQAQFTNSNRIAAQFGNNKKLPKAGNRVNTNCDINVPNDPSNKNICAVESIDMLCDDVSGNEEMNLQMPSASAKSEGSNADKLDIVTVDLTAAPIGAESSSPIASTSTGSKGSNDASPHAASTERAIADGPSTSAMIQFAGNRATLSPTVSQAASIGVASCNKLSAAEPSATSAEKPIKLTENDRLLAARNSIITLRLTPSNDSTVVLGERKVLKGVRRKEINPNRNVVPQPELQMHNDVMPMLHNKDTNRIKNPQLKDSVKASVTSNKSLQEMHGFAVKEEKICPVRKAIAQRDDEQYLYLSGIFPDADSTYLRKIVARTNGSQEEIMNFIQLQWENPTYPTKEEKLRRTRITDQQKQYISNFHVIKFLQIFPDPFKHFEDPTRQCKKNANAFTFLKFHFKYHKQATLRNIYESCNYNLNSTATIVEQVPPDRQSARVTHLWEKCPSEDIPLLQECAFIMHKADIRKYFEKLKKKEDAEFRRLKEHQELLECQCCYDSECMPSKCSTCNDGHIFCNACIVRGTESNLAQGKTHIPCFMTCDEEFSLATLQKVLSPTQFSILIGKRQEEEVMAAGLEGLVSCPFCHFATIPPPEDKIFKCLNPACMKESCRLCKELNHIPLKCYEKETDKARLLLEEKMTEALVRKCYQCSRPYFKEDGCNKITCSCGALMCYICDKPVEGYEHFNVDRRGYSHPCPLVSDNNLINNATVEAVAKKTIEYIRQKDPNVKLTAPTVLPQQYLNNSALSDRVSKIAKFDT
ncbi:uncharacterized protein LOC143374821 [Andrena cerasifolii]|uniref:uncharacterized protein LOC143374821 n=1 Tax=Andrena cerasifolii TaxID=2819439 RepID=UPI004037E6D3